MLLTVYISGVSATWAALIIFWLGTLWLLSHRADFLLSSIFPQPRPPRPFAGNFEMILIPHTCPMTCTHFQSCPPLCLKFISPNPPSSFLLIFSKVSWSLPSSDRLLWPWEGLVPSLWDPSAPNAFLNSAHITVSHDCANCTTVLDICLFYHLDICFGFMYFWLHVPDIKVPQGRDDDLCFF